MSDGSDRARFAAREYIARVQREMGEGYTDYMSEHDTVVFETGYMRGAVDESMDFRLRLDTYSDLVEKQTAYLSDAREREEKLHALLLEGLAREKALAEQLQTALLEGLAREKELGDRLQSAYAGEKDALQRAIAAEKALKELTVFPKGASA